MKRILTLVFALLTAFASLHAQCSETDQTKVLLVGDSWAFFMGVDQTINQALEKWGHSNYKYFTNLTLAENGAETEDFLLPAKQQEIQAQLSANPDIEVVHLSIGGNDVLNNWNVSFTQHETDSLASLVFGQIVQIINFIKSCKPGIHIVWSGYCYPNFEEVIESAAPFQTSHPFYGTWSGMGFPDFEQINTQLVAFSMLFEAYAAGDPDVTFINAGGLMQYTFGQNSPLGVAPGGTYPPQSVPLPNGNPLYPSPKNSMRDYLITKDCFHLSPQGYDDFIEYQTQKFYHKYLMDDQYLLSDGGTHDGSVSSAGNIAADLKMGESGGEAFSTVLTFHTTAMTHTSVTKASIFLRRESLSGDNPINGPIQVKVINGSFGASYDIEAADITTSPDATDTPCRFGSNGGDGHWIRLELPASILPYIKHTAETQFMLSVPGFTGGVITFSDASDPDFAPVLNLTFDPSTPNGIEAVAADYNLQVFPNPASTEFSIRSTDCTPQSAVLYDMLGHAVAQYPSLQSQSTLDVSSLPAGMYMLQVVTDKGVRNEVLALRAR